MDAALAGKEKNMNNFEFYSPTRFVFGKGAEEKISSAMYDVAHGAGLAVVSPAVAF